MKAYRREFAAGGARELLPVRTDCTTERHVADPHSPKGIGTDRTVAATARQNELDRDESGHHKYLGYVIRRGAWTLYHSGDTLRYPGLAEKLRAFRIDVAFLPINGNKPGRRVAGNLDGPERR